MKVLHRNIPWDSPRLGFSPIVGFLVSAALSFIASRITARRTQPPFQDAPTPLTSRGARVPVVIGRVQVAPVHAAVGLRSEVGGSSGPNYREEAWQVLCVGPMRAMHGIYQEGSPISPSTLAKVFPTTPGTHPSGTLLFFPGFGRYVNYWGEESQPSDFLLEDLLGIASKWMEVGHIVHRSATTGQGSGKDLGPSAFWSQINYEVEVAIQRIGLFESTPYWDDVSETDTDNAAASIPGLGTASTVIIATADAAPFLVGNDVEVYDATPSTLNGIYRVVSKTVLGFIGGTPTQLILNPAGPFNGAALTIAPRVFTQYSGANPAHVIWQWLFGGWPHGMGLDADKFDLESLEELGQVFDAERAPVNFAVRDGMTVEGALTRLMQDHSIVRTFNREGKIRFVALREPAVDDIVSVPADAILSPLPELASKQGPQPVTRVLYEFNDRERNFQVNVVPIASDGDSSTLDFAKDRKVELHTVTDYPTAERIANRRGQEDLGRTRAGDVFVGRQMRDLANGQVVALEGYPGTWRVLGIQRDTLSTRTKLQVIRDVYDVAPAAGTGDPGTGVGGGGGGTGNPLQPDVAQAVIEVPPWWGAATGTSRVLFLRGRASSAIIASQVYTSSTAGGIATAIGAPQPAYAVLSLDSDLDAGTNVILGIPGYSDGPAVTLQGADVGAAQDLSTDETGWKTGTQVAVIGGGPTAEVCFLRRLVDEGSGAYTLEGLIRARYDTEPRTWPAGTLVYVGARAALEALTSATFAPGVTRYFKCPAQTATETLPLADAAEISHAIAGKNVVPVAPGNLRGFPSGRGINVAGFLSGDSLEFSWTQRRADLVVGYGQQPYGTPHAPASLLGSMIHRLYADESGAPAASPALVVNQGATTGVVYTYAQLFTTPGAPFESLVTHQERAIWFSIQHSIGGQSSPEVFLRMVPV